MREPARQDFVLAYRDESVDRVHRDMLLKNTENGPVVPVHDGRRPRRHRPRKRHSAVERWQMEEETQEERTGAAANSRNAVTPRD